MALRLPDFETAIHKLAPGEKTSIRPLLVLIRAFQTRVNEMSSDAYTARRLQMQKMIERELHSLGSLKSMQSQFAALAGVLVLFVIFELFISHRVNMRLKKAMAEKEALLVTDGLTASQSPRLRNGIVVATALQRLFAAARRSRRLQGGQRYDGPSAGDALLRHVARALAANATASGGIVARLGGDEFAVLLKGSRHRAMDYAEAVLGEYRPADYRRGQEHPGDRIDRGGAFQRRSRRDALRRNADEACRPRALCGEG